MSSEQKENEMNTVIPEVEFINVHKSFINQNETVHILKGIDEKVEKGSITTIIGPSGSGKSTILSLCNLLQTPERRRGSNPRKGSSELGYTRT